MKKALIILISIFVVGCSSQKGGKDAKSSLYEVLLQNDQGGAEIEFYEILSEAKEIKMLLGDPALRRKIDKDDIIESNFVILNLGEKSSSGYSIGVDTVKEYADRVVITVKSISPKEGSMTASVMTYPYTIVKINSKKKIEFK